MNKLKLVTYVYCAKNQESLEKNRKLETDLGVKFSQVADISQLFTKIADSKQHTDYVFIDVEKFYEVKETSMFDLVRTLSTLISCSGDPAPRLVAMLDLDTDPAQIKELMSIAALDGFYPRGRDFSVDEKRQALQDLAAGRGHVPARIKKLLKTRKKSHDISYSGYEGITLTPRQKQVLELVTRQGASNKIIARTLCISESTVKLHMTSILKKYGARNRTQLAVFSNRT